MMHPVALVADPGIDAAFAIALALHDPGLSVLGLAATAGNIPAEQSTKNAHIVIEQIDPPRWPRIGAALAVEYEIDGTRLHGANGLGNTSFPCAALHHLHPGDKLLVDLVRQQPHEVTVICLGPLTTVARAFDREPELRSQIKRLVCLGGTWHEPGNASAAGEFHFQCDPLAARQVLRSGVPLTLIPLDVTRKLLFAPGELRELLAPDTRSCAFLRQVVPFGVGATSNVYGLEGIFLNDVLGIVAVSHPGLVTTKPMIVDVEVRGELTRGMSVVDARTEATGPPNVDLVLGADMGAVKKYISRMLDAEC